MELLTFLIVPLLAFMFFLVGKVMLEEWRKPNKTWKDVHTQQSEEDVLKELGKDAWHRHDATNSLD